MTPVKPQKGASSPLICSSPSLNDVLLSDGCGSFSRVSGTLIASGSSSPGVQYFRGQYRLGGSFNLEVFGKLGEGGLGQFTKFGAGIPFMQLNFQIICVQNMCMRNMKLCRTLVIQILFMSWINCQKVT